MSRPLIALLAVLGAAALAAPAIAERPLRVVSLGPSLTAILLELGAGELLVGVDDRSLRMLPAVAGQPRVGGFFNPSLEAIVALGPDLVVLVPGAEQRSLQERLEALDIEVLALPNTSLAELLASIETLGGRVGRPEQARQRVAEIREAFRIAETESVAAKRPRTVLVLQRDPLFVVGRGSFIDRMLFAAGLDNLAGTFESPYPRVSVEWLIAAAPEVILDASEERESALAYWSRWPSLPAVAAGGVMAVAGLELTLPGPRPDAALASLRELLPAGSTAPGDAGAVR
ncbi:MAG: helical backbone metal receptor [Myxococcota bacterium]